MATAAKEGEVPGSYGALLAAVSAGDRDSAARAAAALLSGGEVPERVYRTVARTLLARGAGGPDMTPPPHGLWALNAALFLTGSLPPAERVAALSFAVGAAAGDAPAKPAVPHALAGAAGGTPSHEYALEALTERVRAASLAGDGAGAEWALAALLAGADRGSVPSVTARRAAYDALFAAAAQAEIRARGWGHLLVGAQHAVEMAELLPASQTLLALRPAVWALARHRSAARTLAPEGDILLSSDRRCALRFNRRPARPGETAQWARALRARLLDRVMEEALASGLEHAALLDAAMLAAVQILASAAKGGNAPSLVSARQARRVSALAEHTLLALHAARRAHDLAPPADDALAAALQLLERLAARTRPLGMRATLAATAIAPADLARAAAAPNERHALAVGEAILAEYEDALPRAADFAADVMGQARTWAGAVAAQKLDGDRPAEVSMSEKARRAG